MIVHEMAAFIKNTTFEKLSEQAVDQLKIRLLDSLRRGIWGTKSLCGRVLTFKD